jgi:hypothetical protein
MKFLDPTWQSTQDWHQVGAHLRRIDTALQNRSATVKADVNPLYTFLQQSSDGF